MVLLNEYKQIGMNMAGVASAVLGEGALKSS